MGLELVELMVDIEETFGLSIPNEEMLRLETPRLVIEYLEARLAITTGAVCLSQRAFYRVRAEVTQQLPLPRSAVRPEVLWERVLPMQRRAVIWERLGRSLGGPQWPALRRPAGLSLSLLGMGLALTALLWWGGSWFSVSGLTVTLAATSFGWLAILATRRYRTVIPAEIATVGQTARYLALHAPAAIKGPRPQWTREEIQVIVTRLIRDHLNISEFDLDHHFVRDLGAG